MFEIQDYIKSVEVNWWVLEKLKDNFGDRLGTIIKFNLKEYPNKDISGFKVREWFKHILALVGYPYYHIQNLGYNEMAECWVTLMTPTELHIRHKYWSYKKAIMIVRLLKEFCEGAGIPYSKFEQAR